MMNKPKLKMLAIKVFKINLCISGGKLKLFLENGETIIADVKTGTASCY